jgi:hypothetical protein
MVSYVDFLKILSQNFSPFYGNIISYRGDYRVSFTLVKGKGSSYGIINLGSSLVLGTILKLSSLSESFEI